MIRQARPRDVRAGNAMPRQLPAGVVRAVRLRLGPPGLGRARQRGLARLAVPRKATARPGGIATVSAAMAGGVSQAMDRIAMAWQERVGMAAVAEGSVGMAGVECGAGAGTARVS